MTATTTAPITSTTQTKPMPYYVSYRFVKDYYTMMSVDPQRLHHFYERMSTLTVGAEGDRDAALFATQEVQPIASPHV